jgi:hypothetical protein
MRFPCSTGEAARYLGTTEPLLAETVRRGKVRPIPDVIAGRRLWSPEQVLQAAAALDLLTEERKSDLGAQTRNKEDHR